MTSQIKYTQEKSTCKVLIFSIYTINRLINTKLSMVGIEGNLILIKYFEWRV